MVVVEDLLGYFDALVAEGAMPYAKLVDARHATPAVSEQDMAAVADKVRSLAAFDPRGAPSRPLPPSRAREPGLPRGRGPGLKFP